MRSPWFAEQIDEYVAKHNRFFQLTGFTLDDLNQYAEPLSRLCLSAFSHAHRSTKSAVADMARIEASKQIEAIEGALSAESDRKTA